MERTILTVAFYTIPITSMTKQQLYLEAFALLKVLGEQSGLTDSQVGFMDFSCRGRKELIIAYSVRESPCAPDGVCVLVPVS